MPLPSNKKLSIIYILKILREYSDENYPLKQAEIVQKLYSLYGMECERKSVGANIESLIDAGYDIVKCDGGGCYLGEREFEPSEIAFLIDAVFSSKAIDSKNSFNLSKKLSAFLSKYQQKKYKYIYKSDEMIRTDNKQLFYTIDVLHEAIEKGKKVEFNYNRAYSKKEKQEKQEHKKYVVNPYFLINNSGKYYLVCNYDYFDEVANYRVEQIKDIKILDNDVKPVTKLKNCENGIDKVKYANENIYMFSNNPVNATLLIENDYAVNYVVDWFGKNAKIYEKDGKTYADVKANEQALIYWCLQYGENIELLCPNSSREKLKQILGKLDKKYN